MIIISVIMLHLTAGIPLVNNIDMNVIYHNEDNSGIVIMSIIDTFLHLYLDETYTDDNNLQYSIALACPLYSIFKTLMLHTV